MQAISFMQRAVSSVQTLQPYQPGKPIEEVERELGISNILKLASNENPLGTSPKAQAALANSLQTLELYPDDSGYSLKQAIADKFGLNSKQITLGNGSNQVLDTIARAFLDHNRAAVFSQYAFAAYPLVTKMVGAALQVAKANPADHPTMPYGHNLANLLERIDAKTHVVFIANPNNPTGTWLEKAELHAFLQQVPPEVIVVIDEAYTEYVQDADFPNALAWLDEFPNLIVTRTFSKIYGLAGLRVGYAVSSPEVADILNRMHLPFCVNSLALAAAQAALADDAFLQHSVTTNSVGLQQWFAACADNGWEYIPSVGNFITIDCKRPAMPLYHAMLREGVIVRPIGGYGLPQHLRITIGTEAQNNRCIAVLKKHYRQHTPDALPPIPTLPHILHARASQLGATPCVLVDGKPVLSWAGYADAVFDLALGLRERGLQPGQRVAILSDNSVDWLIVQLAIYAAGLISVPLLPASSDHMLERILQHAEPQALFVDASLLPRAMGLQETAGLPALLITMNGTQADLPGLADVAMPAAEANRQQLLKGINAQTPALIGYTSGSTGDPKGVFKNHAATVINHGFGDADGKLVAAQPEQSAGLILSLNHGMGQGLFYRALVRGYTLSMTELPEADIHLAQVAALQPSVLWVVPRVIKRLVEEFDAHHPEWLARWEQALAAEQGNDSPAMTALRHTLQQAFGGHLAEIHSSGSPTPPALLKRFAAVGLPLWEFYGTTETGIITNGSADGVPGMTGFPVAGLELRFEADGELQVRGPGVSLGYFRDATATAELLDAQGWCKTGDLAALKPEGLHITGRKKDIFNTSEGSNMYPSRVEGSLEELPLVAEAVLLGDRRPFIAALLVPDSAKAEQELGRALTAADYQQGSALHQAVMRAVERMNPLLESYEHVRKVTLLPEPFPPTVRTQVGGIRKTRIRRDLIEQLYQTEIQQVYTTP